MPGTRRGPQRLCRQLGAMQIPAANCCPAAAPCKPAAHSSKPRGGFVQRQQAALGSVAASSLFPYSNAGGFWGPQHEIPQGRGAACAQISASSPRSSRRALIAGSSSGSAGSCPEPCPEPAANAGWWQPLAPSPGLRAGESSWRRRGERCPPPPGTCCLLPRCSRCQAPHGAAFPVARCRQHRGWGFATPPSCRRRFWAQGAAVPWPGAVGGSPKKRGPAAARLPPRSRTGHPRIAQPRLSPVPPELPNPAHRARSPAVPVPAGPLAPSARATAGSRRSPVLPGQPPSRLSPVPPGLPVPGIPHASRSLSPTPPGVTTGPPALHAPCSALP